MDTKALALEQKRKRRRKGLAQMQACRARHLLMGEDTLLTNKEVARLLGCCVRQIYFMIHRQRFPHRQSWEFSAGGGWE